MDPTDPLPTLPSGPKPTTQANRDIAHVDAVKAAGGGFLTFAGLSLGVQLFLKPRYPHAADFISRDIGSLPSSRPGEAVRAYPTVGKVTFMYALPAPLGIAPPELYGIRPDFMVPNPEQSGPEYVWLMKQLGAVPSKARVDYYFQREADKFEAEFRERMKRYPTDAVIAVYNDYSRPGRQEQLPRQRVERLLDIVRDELGARQAVFNPLGADQALPSGVGVFPGGVPSVLPTLAADVVSVGGGGDYGGGGGDPLAQVAAANGSGPITGKATDPLPAPARADNQHAGGIPNALGQEANRRAPPLLRELLTERTDP